MRVARSDVGRRGLGGGRGARGRGGPRRHRHPPGAVAQPEVLPHRRARLLHDRGRQRRPPRRRRHRHPLLRLGPERPLPRGRGRGLHRTSTPPGRTPNPCLRCNEKIKFAAVLDRAIALGFDAVATGHYAQLRRGDDGLIEMHRAVDMAKDQSYVLGVLDPGAARALDVPARRHHQGRRSARRRRARGLAVADKPDSHDICFITDGDTRGWLRRQARRPGVNHGGSIVDSDGAVLGSPRGAWRFTIGQRKGLRIGTPARRRPAALRARHRAGLRHGDVGPRERAGRRRAHRHQAALVRHRPPRRCSAPSSCAPTARSTAAVVRVDGDAVEVDLLDPATASRPARPSWCTTGRASSGRPRSPRRVGPTRRDHRVTRWPPASGRCPARTSHEALRVVLGELPDLPHLPELPGRGAHGRA